VAETPDLTIISSLDAHKHLARHNDGLQLASRLALAADPGPTRIRQRPEEFVTPAIFAII